MPSIQRKVVTALGGGDPVKAVVSALRKKQERYRRGTERGIKHVAIFLLEASREFCPIDTKDLYNSSRVEVRGRLGTTEAKVTYNTDYAVYVHEDLTKAHGATFNRKYSDEISRGVTHARRPQEQAKFLERPVRTRRPTMRQIFNTEIFKARGRP